MSEAPITAVFARDGAMEAEVGATTKHWDEVSDEKWLVEGHVRHSLWNKREPCQAYFDGARNRVRKKLEKQGVLHVRLRVRNSSSAVNVAVEACVTALPAAFSSVDGAAAAFEKQGYVLLKMPTAHADYNEESVDTVQREIQEHFRAEQASVSYKFWRVFNSVNTAENRHSVGLPLTPTLHRLLRGAIGSMGAFLTSQLPDPSSPLVELSAVIALPGANCQAVHTDIPFPRHDKLSSDTLILTTMLALKPITKTHGPTFLYEGSHTRSFHALHRKHTQPNGNTHYDAYGDLDAGKGEDDGEEDAEEGKGVPDAALVAPVVVFAGLDPGDVLVFDAKLFHFGGANGSDQSRDLLSWSFQKPVAPPAYDVGGENVSLPIDGFTYHMDPAVRGQRHKLRDFGP